MRPLDAARFSSEYTVRALTEDDLEAVYALSAGNTLFYEYHPPFVTLASLREDREALPPGKGMEDKYYVGFFREDALVAVLDLIAGYPDEETAFLGLFMMEHDRQGQGIGSRILGDCLAALKDAGFAKVRLGVDRGNPQSNAFWRKNGFTPDETAQSPYIVMERKL